MNYENEGHRPDGDDPRYSGILHSESWLSGYIVLFAAFELVALIDEFFAATEHLVEVGVDELEILLLVVGFVVGHVGLSGGVDYESVDAVFAGNDYELLVSLCAGDLAEHLDGAQRPLPSLRPPCCCRPSDIQPRGPCRPSGGAPCW